MLVARARRGRRTRSSAARTPGSKITSASGARRSGRATALPRTEGTQKLKRRELQRWAGGEQPRPPVAGAAGSATVEDVVARFAAGRALDARDDARGARPELARSRRADDGARGGVPHDARRERRWREAKTIGELEALVGSGVPEFRGAGFRSLTLRSSRLERSSADARARRRVDRLSRPGIDRRPSWFLRRISLPTWILPLGRVVHGDRRSTGSSTSRRSRAR